MISNPMQVSWRERLRLVAFEAGLFLFAAVLIGAATAFARAATAPATVDQLVAASDSSLQTTPLRSADFYGLPRSAGTVTLVR